MLRIVNLSVLSLFVATCSFAQSEQPADDRSATRPLFASGVVTSKTPGHAVQVDVEVRGVPRIFLVVTDAGDGITCDFANWADAHFVTPTRRIDLRDLKWTGTKSSWGEVQIDLNAERGPMRINGQRVKGIGTHANSLIAYNVPEDATRFRALAGLDSQGVEEGGGSTIKFFVYGHAPEIEIERLRIPEEEQMQDEDEANVRRFKPGSLFESESDSAALASPVRRLRLAPGFRAELVYRVPLKEQGSWVSLTVDPRGRLVASDQQAGLYRITLPAINPSLKSPRVQRLNVDLGGAQGLLFAHGCLYAVVNGRDSGLYRLSDKDGDDEFEQVELLRRFEEPGEHGPHAVILGPDKQSLFVLGGNSCFLTKPPERSRVPRVWQEDRLLVRSSATDGPWDEEQRIGGWICRTDADGKEFELFAMGFRNPYDIAFDKNGELLTFDADMEWDVGTPWYRPTRINHVISGADYGWRAGSAKWPDDFIDSFGSVVDVGLSSPTGVVFGYDSRFPDKYRNAFFAADWSLGNIYAVHLQEKGASYTAEFEPFVSGAPLPVTDLVIHPQDGAMYFTVGGRGITSALYRVSYAGEATNELVENGRPQRQEARAPVAAALEDAHRLRALRRRLEQWHNPGVTAELDTIWPYLSHSDRAIRYAARIALEHRPMPQWTDYLDRERNPRSIIAAGLSLSRLSATGQVVEILPRLNALSWNELSESDQNDLLRTYTVMLHRFGRDETESATIRSTIANRIAPLFPTQVPRLDRQLAELMSFLEIPNSLDRLLDHLQTTKTQEEQIHYVMCLRDLDTNWSLDQQRRLFRWFQLTAEQRGGVLFGDYLEQIRLTFEERLSDRQKDLLSELLERPDQTDPYEKLKQRAVVKRWTVDELQEALRHEEQHGDIARGRDHFATALCFRCHRFAGQGGRVGPDLTGVTRRFNTRDILEAIVEPSKVISDQYSSVQILTEDGLIVTGKITDISGNTLLIMNDPLNPADITMVKRDSIEEMNWSPTSGMPEELLDTFTIDEIRDVFAFLQSHSAEAFARQN